MKLKVNASNTKNTRNTTSTKEVRDLNSKFTPQKGRYVAIEKPTKEPGFNPLLSQPTTKIKIELLIMRSSSMMRDTNLPGLPTWVRCSTSPPSHLETKDSKSNKFEMVLVGVSKTQEMDEMHSNKPSQGILQSHFKSCNECSRVERRSGYEC